MTNRFVHALGLILLFGGTLQSVAQDASPQDLSLDDAIKQAIDHNATLAKARLETRRTAAEVAANRTKLFATTSVSVQGAELLTQPSITFAQGSLGSFPSTGPIPSTDTVIKIPRDFVSIVNASVSQPITYEIKNYLKLKSLRFGLEGTRQDERKELLTTIDDVRRAYYSVLNSQSQMDSAKASLLFYQESKRVADEDRSKETILDSDRLRANAQLLKAQNSVSEASDQLTSDAEKLNDLMGRPVHTVFRATGVPEPDAEVETLSSLEAKALENRPDVKKAKATVLKDEYDRRSKAAEYIPEVSAAINYYTTINFGNTLPSNITTGGLSLSWEPWDWGRRRQEVREKRFQRDESQASETQTERSALIEVNQAWRQLRDARRKLHLGEAKQLTAREQLREVQEEAKREQKLPKDLFSAQSDLASADDEYLQALTAFWKARADLKKAIGEE